MEHAQIEEHNIIDRYVRGTMPVDLRADFEEHFLDCPECLEQLKLASALRDGLRLSAAELAASASPQSDVSFIARWRSSFDWRWAVAIAAACLVLASMPTLVLLRQLGSVTNELSRDRAALGTARKMMEEVERASAAVYILTPVRGDATPANVAVPAAPVLTVLSLESDFTRFATYRATLRNDRDQIVWQKDQLHPSSPDAIGIVLGPSALATAGAYRLVVEGEDGQGRYVLAATFSLSISPAQ
jgi:hypothetical protein